MMDTRHRFNASGIPMCTVASKDLIDELVDSSPVDVPDMVVGSPIECWLCLALEDYVDRLESEMTAELQEQRISAHDLSRSPYRSGRRRHTDVTGALDGLPPELACDHWAFDLALLHECVRGECACRQFVGSHCYVEPSIEDYYFDMDLLEPENVCEACDCICTGLGPDDPVVDGDGYALRTYCTCTDYVPCSECGCYNQ